MLRKEKENKMKYLRSLLLLPFLTLFASGCSKENKVTNSAPSIVGVKDIKCIVNTEVDFLSGVAAIDKEEGDITPNIKINVTPYIEVVDGYALFTEEGEYAVTYTISDKEGRTSQKSSYVNVLTREQYVKFDMPSGFYYETNGKAKMNRCGMVNGDFLVEATGHEIAEDIKVNRIFKLKTNTQYTFKFTIEARCAGKITALADGYPCGELQLDIGHNVVSFKHIVLDDSEDKKNVEISLCLGNILGDIDLTIAKLETEYPQHEGDIVDLTEDWSFLGRVIRRFEGGIEGNAWSDEEGLNAILEVTTPGTDIWAGGMFINTGIELKAGVKYSISFDIISELGNLYEAIVQRGQWDEYKYKVYSSPNGHCAVDVIPNEATKGALWIYVQSGKNVNRITMSNLKVEEHLGPVGRDTYIIEDYKESHSGGYSASFSSELGNYKYLINKFGNNDYDQKVSSPTFFVNGSSGNYVLSFKAKASAPIEVVVAAPVSGGWDPTIMWSRINLSEEETTYTFFFNTNSTDRDYQIVWQFGSGNNQKYENVQIEVNNVEISLRNIELDGSDESK